MTIHVRPVDAEEMETFQQTMSVPFGFDPTAEMRECFNSVFELGRLARSL